MNKQFYYQIEGLTTYMQSNFDCKVYRDLHSAIIEEPGLFFTESIDELSFYNINKNDNYICYVFSEREHMYILASFYSDNTIKTIYIPDEYEHNLSSARKEELKKFLPFNNCDKNKDSVAFDNYIKKFNNIFDENNIIIIFNELYNAEPVASNEDVAMQNNCYDSELLNRMELYQNGSGYKSITFRIHGENNYVPILENNCFVTLTFSNNKVVGIASNYENFRYRRDLDKLINNEEVIKMLT